MTAFFIILGITIITIILLISEGNKAKPISIELPESPQPKTATSPIKRELPIYKIQEPTQIVQKVIDASFVAIDFETANRHRSSACVIGMCKVLNGKVVDKYVQYLKPEPFEFEDKNVYIHGIDEDKTRYAPTIAEDWDNIKAFVGGLPLVAHNASFDKSVLNRSLEATGAEPSGWHIDCTMLQAKQVLQGRANYKLDDLSRAFGIGLSHHDAGSDAEACARLYLHLLSLNPNENYNISPSVSVLETDFEQKGNILQGLTIVFTGEFDSHSRTEIEILAQSYGAKVTSSVSSKTDYLVVGRQVAHNIVDGVTTKERKVFELQSAGGKVQILKEKAFLRLLKAGKLPQTDNTDTEAALKSARAMVSRLSRNIRELPTDAQQKWHTDYPKYEKYKNDLTIWEARKEDCEMAIGGIIKRKTQA